MSSPDPPVIDAVKSEDPTAIDLLRGILDADPAAVHAWSVDGFTALHYACWLGRRDAAALLLDRGADVAAVSRNAMRVQPLHSAAAGRHAPVVALLLARGADPNARQHQGFVPLHASAQSGDPESARLLLKAGADPAAATDDGRTPLLFAAESKRAELIVPMIEAALAKRGGA